MISAAGLRALRTLRDCGVASARWDHPGFRELRVAGLVTHKTIEGGAKVVHNLNDKGRALAQEQFG